MKRQLPIFFVFLFLVFPHSIAFGLTAEELASQLTRPDSSYKERLEFTNFLRKHIPLLVEIAKNLTPPWSWKRIIAISHLEDFSRDGSFSRKRFFDLTCEVLSAIQRHERSEGNEEENRYYISVLCGYSFERYKKKPRLSLIENFATFILLVSSLEQHGLIFDKTTAASFKDKIESAKKEAAQKEGREKAILIIKDLVVQTSSLGEKTFAPVARRLMLWYGENLIFHIQVEYSGQP